MTRDEQIAQLKPGDVVLLDDGHFGKATAVVWAVRGDIAALYYPTTVRDPGLFVRHASELILPDPPPKPKAEAARVGSGSTSPRI